LEPFRHTDAKRQGTGDGRPNGIGFPMDGSNILSKPILVNDDDETAKG